MFIAIFISGRIKNYQNFFKLINRLTKQHTVKIFASVNSFSLDNPGDEGNFKKLFQNIIGDTYFDFFKIPKEIVQISSKYGKIEKLFPIYNQISCFWNDNNNFKMIEKYQKENNVKFDIICKMRTEMLFSVPPNFIKDNNELKILRNKHLCEIRHWGHRYKNTPILVSDAFCYGNFNSMKIYCDTINFFKQKLEFYKGEYSHTFEPLLNDNIFDFVFDPPNKEKGYMLTKKEIINAFENNPRGFVIILDNFSYNLLPVSNRSKKNFTVNKGNSSNYVEYE